MTQFPLSPAQSLVQALHNADPTRRRQSTRRIFDVLGPLDVKAFDRAVETLIRRHEPLRTVYPSKNRQVVKPEAHEVLHLVSERQPWAAFDLERGPLLSITIQRLGPDHHEISFCVHLLAADAWSLEVLFDDLCTLYRAEIRGVPAQLPELAIQYIDWAAWHAGRVTPARRAELARWWRGALDGYPQPRRRDSTTAPESGRRRTATLDSGTVSEIHTLAGSAGHTTFTLLAAAFAVTLTCQDYQDRLLLGLAVANRDHVAVERLLGFYVTLTVLPVDLRGNPCFSELMCRIAEATAAVYDHRELPFPDIVSDREAARGAQNSFAVPMPVIFAHHPPGTLGTLSLDSCNVVEVPVSDTAKFVMTIRVQDTADGTCDIWAEYDPSVHNDKSVDTLLEAYKTVLTSIVSHTDPPISVLRSRLTA